MHPAAIILSSLCLFQPAPTTPPSSPPAATPPAAPAQPTAPAAHPPLFVGDTVETVSEGHMFVEGPCWVKGEGEKSVGFFLFCERDRDGGKVFKWSGVGTPEVWRTPTGQAIGTAVDSKGRIHQAQSESRAITRIELKDGKPGEVTVLADKIDGKRLNATNDLVVHSGGAVYFTDPAFFTPKPDLELDYLGVMRIAPDGTLAVLDKSLTAPNGLCFSPDEKTLYVNDFMANIVCAFNVRPDGTLDARRVFAELKAEDPRAKGRADGLRCDQHGNVYTSGPGGIQVFSPAGVKIGHLTVPGVSNLAFGGDDGRTLLITAGRSTFTIKTVNKGAGL